MCDRRAISFAPAPPQGLYLYDVHYNDEDMKWEEKRD